MEHQGMYKENQEDRAGRFQWLQTTPERLLHVTEEISQGSEPKISFYALLASASLIASFGLIANSTAVIIGAMLVSPLMTPIIGISLALVLGDTSLLGRALRAEAMGVALAIGIAAFLGVFPLALEVTPEMLSRTEPNLLDLLVAVLAGFAGTYALIDARLSPALPGVAIATAIVPPLANSGLCLAMGAFHGAWGSFLLFFANFLAILLVSAGTFVAAGMAPRIPWSNKWEFARTFGVAVAGFLIVALLLTHTLVRIVKERYLNNAIRENLTEELSGFPSTSLVELWQKQFEDKLYILATVRTPSIISPDKVTAIQEVLSRRLNIPTELIIRAILAKDVSATGSTSQVTAQNLDGFFISRKLNPEVMRIQLAEQALREVLIHRPDIILSEVKLVQFPRGPVVVANLQTSRPLTPEEVKELEEKIQERLFEPNIRLLTRCLSTIDIDAHGRILYAWSHFGSQSPVDAALQDKVEKAVATELGKFPGLFVNNVDALAEDDRWSVRVEASGIKIPTSKELNQVEKSVSRRVNRNTFIYLWFRSETMLTREGLLSVEDFTNNQLRERKRQ
ncbi:TIGR00341 family protein [Desulfobacca acetoxidans]